MLHPERELFILYDCHGAGPHSFLRNLFLASGKHEKACNEKEFSCIHQLNNSRMFPAACYRETENNEKQEELNEIKSCHTFA